MSRFKYYLEAVSESESELTQKQKTQKRLEKLAILDQEVGKKIEVLKPDIEEWSKSGHEFMEKIKEEWTLGWKKPESRSQDFQKVEREFKREGNTYYITLQTPASSESDKGKYSHTTVDKFLNPNKIEEEENIADARRRDILQMALHTTLFRLKESKSLPAWIESFKKYNNTLEIKIQ